MGKIIYIHTHIDMCVKNCQPINLFAILYYVLSKKNNFVTDCKIISNCQVFWTWL